MEDKGYLVMFVPILVLTFPLLPGEGIYSAHSSKVSAFSQMGEALTKSISSSINLKYSKWHTLGWHACFPHSAVMNASFRAPLPAFQTPPHPHPAPAYLTLSSMPALLACLLFQL